MDNGTRTYLVAQLLTCAKKFTWLQNFNQNFLLAGGFPFTQQKDQKG
jgi:hypothetical protein